jgi:carboxyl-terminal processing protease
MSSSVTSRPAKKRVWLLSGAALAALAAGFGFSPLPPATNASRTTVRVASLPGTSLGLILPLPEESRSLSASEAREANAAMPPVETYSKVLRRLESSYYNGKSLSERDLTYAAIRGMLASLGDKYTRFLDPDEFRRFEQNDVEGKFGGIGATLEKLQGKVVIVTVLPNTPAQKSGIKEGDAILAVDGKTTSGLSLSDVVDQIRGKEGTPVKLTLERKGVLQHLNKTILRGIINVPNVTSEIIKGPDGKPTGIARIQLRQFTQNLHSQLDDALSQMQKKGMKGLILDLRGNPGGLLTEAVAVGSRFIDSGPIVYTVHGGDRQSLNVIRSSVKYHGPLVVLVNKGSASASEIVTGAIKDNNRGVVVGTDTYGKGLVQTINPIQEDGSAVIITREKYLTPNGTDINKKGIPPDYKVTITKEDVEKKQDPQLQKAISILKGEMNAPAKTANAAGA